MLMIASGDASNAYQNLKEAGTPDLLANLMSKAPYIALNFWVWAFSIAGLAIVGYIDWKHPHIFPKKVRRLQLTRTEKQNIRELVSDISEIQSEILNFWNLQEKNKSAPQILKRVNSVRSRAIEMRSGNLSRLAISFCRHAERVYQLGRYHIKDRAKMERTTDRISLLAARITD